MATARKKVRLSPSGKFVAGLGPGAILAQNIGVLAAISNGDVIATNRELSATMSAAGTFRQRLDGCDKKSKFNGETSICFQADDSFASADLTVTIQLSTDPDGVDWVNAQETVVPIPATAHGDPASGARTNHYLKVIAPQIDPSSIDPDWAGGTMRMRTLLKCSELGGRIIGSQYNASTLSEVVSA